MKLILRELWLIRHELAPKFTLHIEQQGAIMAAITAGQSGTFFLTATAADNSTVVLASPTLTADDTNVVIAPDLTDPRPYVHRHGTGVGHSNNLQPVRFGVCDLEHLSRPRRPSRQPSQSRFRLRQCR